jgi:6-hydroxytryprostatin B O-methyltransferase
VFSHIPLDTTVSYETLATKTNVPVSLLKSVTRMAMTNNILTEPTTGQVAHTANSAMFVKFPNTRDWASYMFTASIPTAAAMVKATEKWPGSVNKTETAYNVAFGHNLPFFDHLSQSPVLTKQFSGYMRSVTDGQGMDLSHLVRGFDWASLPDNSLIVDVSNTDTLIVPKNYLLNFYRLAVLLVMRALLWPLLTPTSASRYKTSMPWSTEKRRLKNMKK